jgi:hypothetical protein
MIGHEETLQRMRLANPAPSADPEELAAVLSVIEQKRGAVSGTTRGRSTDPSRQNTERVWYRRPAATVALAALGVCAVIIPIALLAGRAGDVAIEPSTTIPLTTTAAPPVTMAAPPTTMPVPTVVAPLLTWVRVEDQEMFAGAAIKAVTRGGPGLIAVGEADVGDQPDEYRGDVAVWVSVDGMAWDRIHDPSFAGQPDSTCSPFEDMIDIDQEVVDVASGPLGTVVTGWDACHGAVWISDDGRTWTEVIDDDWLGNSLAVRSVTAGGPGWVAVGGDGHGNGVVWVSEDGVDWTAVHDEDFQAPTESRVDLLDVTTGGPGLVAVGSTGFWRTESEQAAIWVSADGFEWEKLPDDTIDHGGLFPIVRDETSDRLMVFSHLTSTAPDWMTWMSTDGINWSPAGSPEEQIESVAWNGDRLVAAGRVSTDGGATWRDTRRDLPEFGSYALSDIIGFGDQIIMVGYQPGVLSRAGAGAAAGSTAAIWIGEWATE